MTIPEVPVEFVMPLQEVKVIVMGRQQEWGLLDKGSENVIIQENLCNEIG